MSINGRAAAVMAAGGLFLWSGVRGGSVLKNLQLLIQGEKPSDQGTTSTTAISPGGTLNPDPPPAGTIAALKVYAQSLLVLHGWPGQFASFNSIVMAESGWNPKIENPSGAYGIAQALGHGTPATTADGHNAYGNYGTSDSICKRANQGSGPDQLVWMTNYIAQVYGDPDRAWAHHQAAGSY